MANTTSGAEPTPVDRAELEALERLARRPLPRWKQTLYVVAVLVGPPFLQRDRPIATIGI